MVLIRMSINSNLSFTMPGIASQTREKVSSGDPTAPANRNQVVGWSESVAQAAQQTVLRPKNSLRSCLSIEDEPNVVHLFMRIIPYSKQTVLRQRDLSAAVITFRTWSEGLWAFWQLVSAQDSRGKQSAEKWWYCEKIRQNFSRGGKSAIGAMESAILPGRKNAHLARNCQKNWNLRLARWFLEKHANFLPGRIAEQVASLWIPCQISVFVHSVIRNSLPHFLKKCGKLMQT